MQAWNAGSQAATREEAASAEYAASQIVAAKLLTCWQADKLLQGKYKGFFLGKYKLLGHLGSGNSGSVFLAEHVVAHRLAAIKVLPAARLDQPDELERFYFAARAAASLDHPNIVRLYDVDHEGQTYFWALEYVDMRNLQQIVEQDGPLSFRLAANYVKQLANGLQQIHAAGYVHRDIRPSHLMLNSQGTIKILDLGLARFDENRKWSLTDSPDENVPGVVDYLAPEQARNAQSVDSRADIYGLGCTLFFLLTGHPPFADGTLTQRLMMHQTQTPPSIHAERPDSPPTVVDLCLRMLAKSPNDRPQTAAEIVEALEKM
jgi:serine/threonine-protein kinase